MQAEGAAVRVLTGHVGRPVGLLLVLLATLALGGRPAAAGDSGLVTARLGISAGEAIVDAPLGLSGAALLQRIPVLTETANALGVRVETVSVGQGFFADEGMLLSENDLDLVVTGRVREIATMAATLGKAFEQSVVFIWFETVSGGQATASIPLPGGAEALTTAVYEQLVTELADGGHVRYAGSNDVIFVANTGDEDDSAFYARMERVRTLLGGLGIATGTVCRGRANFLAVERDEYDGYISGATVAAVPAAAGPVDLRANSAPACI